ncbi:UDP-N-acetylglucosamine 2-epimerase [Verrucomicrobiota bacterium]
MSKRKIAIFTGNRAEYGLQYPIVKAVANHPDLEYYLLVSGAHLQEDFGYTLEEINKDGFEVYKEVEIKMEKDNLFSTVQAIGSCVLSLSGILDELRPDFHVVYADRFEGFAAVISSTQMGIPTAHIEGGDITEGGALDDSVRHAMTKLAHLHFTTNEEAAERIRKMGEESWRVHNVGFPAIDLIQEQNYATADELVDKYGLDLNRPIILFTQHSVATEHDSALAQLAPSIEAMKILAGEGYQVILTFPNNDAGGKRIIGFLKDIDKQGLSNIQVHASLGRYNYHGILNVSVNGGNGVCVGNSSSGIKETPAFGCPCVNIGSRQQGRLRADNVIDVDYAAAEIIKACRKSIKDEGFRRVCRECVNPYGNGDAGVKIAKVLAETEISQKLVQKRMVY